MRVSNVQVCMQHQIGPQVVFLLLLAGCGGLGCGALPLLFGCGGLAFAASLAAVGGGAVLALASLAAVLC